MRILLTGARAYYALPVIRELARRGHQVTAADWHPHSTGFYSRFTSARLVLPRLGRDGEAFVAAVERHLEDHPHDLVLPLFEEAIALSRARGRIERHARLPVADYATMLRFHDKRRLYEFAGGLPVSVPRTWPWPQDERFEHLPFPLVLKIPQSSSARGVAVVRDPTGLRAAWRTLRARHALPESVAPILQQHVAGEQLCTLGFAWHGAPKGTLVYRSLCEFPARGGASVARISVDHPAIVASAETLLRAAGYHGMAGFDFMVDRDGRPWLIDANPRPTPGILLALTCGLDLLAMALGEDEPAPASEVRAGLRTRVDPLVAVWMLRALVPGPGFRRRVRLAASFLRPKRESRSDLFDRGDLASLRALGWALVDASTAWLRHERSGLQSVADSQFTDYGA